MRQTIRTLALAGACLMGAAVPAAAAGPDRETKIMYEIFDDYRGDYELSPCDYTTAELEIALGRVTPDIIQYNTDFPRALRTAIATRARGACEVPTPAPTAAPTVAPAVVAPPVTPSGGSGGPKAPEATPVPLRTVVPEPPAPVVAATAEQAPLPKVELDRAAAARPGSDAPVPLIGLGVLSALVLLAAALLSTLRRLGRPAGRLAAQNHTWREARWRVGGVWEDFRDWFATGR